MHPAAVRRLGSPFGDRRAGQPDEVYDLLDIAEIQLAAARPGGRDPQEIEGLRQRLLGALDAKLRLIDHGERRRARHDMEISPRRANYHRRRRP